jgi:hypothetical protein
LNSKAECAYRLGLDDHEKFASTENRPATPCRAWDSNTAGTVYPHSNGKKKRFVADYRAENHISSDTFAVGMNTGCSEIYRTRSSQSIST